MKIIIVFGLFLLTACSGMPFSKSMTFAPRQASDQELFMAALDQFTAAQSLALLDDLQQRHPDSRWAAYAETITKNVRELNTLKAQLQSTQTEDQPLLDELAALKQENLQLAEQLSQLKELLIELEKRPQ